jgi:hypothetical protein
VGLELQKIGKRKTKVLVALLSLSILLSSSLTPMAYGTIEKEYEYSYIWFNPDISTLLFRFKVKVIIETEADGTWIPDIWYRIDFIISLDYINHSEIKYLIFYAPSLICLTYYAYEPISNRTCMEYSGQMNFLCFKAKAYPQAFNPRLFIKPSMNINYTYSKTGWSHSLFWCGEEPIYINKKESPEVLQPFSVTIGVVIGLVIGVGSTLLGIKIGEKRAEKKKANP